MAYSMFGSSETASNTHLITLALDRRSGGDWPFEAVPDGNYLAYDLRHDTFDVCAEPRGGAMPALG